MRTQVALLVACAASANAFSPSAPGLAGARRAGVAYVSGRQPFVPAASPGLLRPSTTELDMFGWLKEAFANEAYAPPAEGVKATARHILVKNLEDINEIKARLDSGATTFEDAARDFSTCPSSREGGSLGSFKPGMMVAEFDQVRPVPAPVDRAHVLIPFSAIGYAQTSRVTDGMRTCSRFRSHSCRLLIHVRLCLCAGCLRFRCGDWCSQPRRRSAWTCKMSALKRNVQSELAFAYRGSESITAPILRISWYRWRQSSGTT